MQEGVHFFLAAQGIKKTRHRSDTLIIVPAHCVTGVLNAASIIVSVIV